MFRALQFPSSGARQIAVAASGFPYECGDVMMGILMPETC
jgi:hypothetical protein